MGFSLLELTRESISLTLHMSYHLTKRQTHSLRTDTPTISSQDIEIGGISLGKWYSMKKEMGNQKGRPSACCNCMEKCKFLANCLACFAFLGLVVAGAVTGEVWRFFRLGSLPKTLSQRKTPKLLMHHNKRLFAIGGGKRKYSDSFPSLQMKNDRLPLQLWLFHSVLDGFF